MATDIHFRRDRALELISQLESGQPITAPEGNWTQAEILLLAGACLCVAARQGIRRRGPVVSDADHREFQEAKAHTFVEDIINAAYFNSMLAANLLNEQYDDQFEPK